MTYPLSYDILFIEIRRFSGNARELNVSNTDATTCRLDERFFLGAISYTANRSIARKATAFVDYRGHLTRVGKLLLG